MYVLRQREARESNNLLTNSLLYFCAAPVLEQRVFGRGVRRVGAASVRFYAASRERMGRAVARTANRLREIEGAIFTHVRL